MNPIVGWALVAAGIAAGWIGYGWPGVVLAVTATVFWLLLQFSRSLRVLKNAAGAPVGHVDSAVMLQSKLEAGMTLMQVLVLTRSLGTRLGEAPECWGWADASGAQLRLVFESGKLHTWTLTRDESGAAAAAPAP